VIRRRLATLVLASLAIASGQPKFTAAKLVLDQLTLFPAVGPPTTIALPRSARSAQVIRSYGNGTSIYLAISITAPKGITKVELNPARESIVPGSEEFGRVSFLTTTADGRLRVSGCRGDLQHAECGVFAIDTTARTVRRIPTGEGHNRQYGEISPDGTHALLTDGNLTHEAIQLSVVNLETGNTQLIKGANSGSWSPDGRWLAAVHNNRLELLDATTLMRRKSLGSADAPGVWSPDSRQILFVKSQLSCALTLYGESLSILDVETGTRRVIESSRCQWAGGPIMWIDAAAVH
jgi:hypothetical protein